MNRRELLPHVVMTASILLSHIHALVTCGAFTAEGEFLDVPELDMDRLREASRHRPTATCSGSPTHEQFRDDRTGGRQVCRKPVGKRFDS